MSLQHETVWTNFHIFLYINTNYLSNLPKFLSKCQYFPGLNDNECPTFTIFISTMALDLYPGINVVISMYKNELSPGLKLLLQCMPQSLNDRSLSVQRLPRNLRPHTSMPAQQQIFQGLWHGLHSSPHSKTQSNECSRALKLHRHCADNILSMRSVAAADTKSTRIKCSFQYH